MTDICLSLSSKWVIKSEKDDHFCHVDLSIFDANGELSIETL